MRIIYLAAYSSAFPSREANSIHIMRMCEAFASLGHEVILIHSDRGKTGDQIFRHYGIEPRFTMLGVQTPMVKGKTILYSLRASSIAMSRDPDLIVTRSPLLGYFSVKRKKVTVFDAHSPVWENSLIDSFPYRLMRKNSYLRKMTTNSFALKELYHKKGLVPWCGITVAHNGSIKVPLDKKAAGWPGRKGVLQVGYVGHLYSGRGVEIIIGCARLAVDCDFHVIGGNQNDIDYWKNRSDCSNLFFHGFVKHSDTYLYRNNCDILLAPYKRENVAMAGGTGDQSKYMNPIKIIEYMSSRKAIVCSDIAALREILDDKSAVFADPEDVNQWVSLINDLRDSEKREILSANAYAKFTENLTWESRARILVS